MMLIIREKPDYYDSAIGYGVDKTVVYHRKTKACSDAATSLAIKEAVEKIESQMPVLRRSLFTPFYVGFCGRIYTGTFSYVHLETGELKASVFRDDVDKYERKFFWLEKDYPKAQLDKVNKNGFYLWDRDRPGSKTLRDWLGAIKQGAESAQVFQDHRLVCFACIDKQITLDPCLKDLGFQRLIGGVEAFQEIAMFISGVLGVLERETAVTEDKWIALSKGFDERSFRKAPTKKI